MTRKFTGWHMLTILIAFFGVVIAVNTFMAVQASRTFGGTVVDNSYVASQEFNHWLDEAKLQQSQGWQLSAATEGGKPTLTTSVHGGPLAASRIIAYAEHPLGQLDDIRLDFRESAPGRYVATQRLPAGRWRLHIRVVQGPRHADFLTDVHA
jgi:nitrogen fixation protein FixH